MNLAERAVEEFGPHRVQPVTFTPALKSKLAAALRLGVEEKRLRLPTDERIRNDWHSLERTVSASGHFRLAASRRDGSHADRFWAAALALHAAGDAPHDVECLNVKPLQFARSGTW